MALRDRLPEPLARRSRVLLDPDGEADPGGGFVLYWMRTAVRGHENPALDAALALGRALDRPVFVYHALSERYPYASDRHHTFILEGARDVAAELAGRGIGYAFHLERPGHRGPHLKTLARRAAAVVTEDVPVAPLRGWTRSLAEAVPAPVMAVDASCLVPMRLVPASKTLRAYLFRKAGAEERARALDELPWAEEPAPDEPFLPELPFEPVPLADADPARLVAACEIDHLVAPVPHTPGGSRAGYARWSGFRDGGGLAGYARRRNDPLRDGVSRMSPYLHYGHVSPFRIAREAREAELHGSDKYLDELLVWRELAWAFCYHHPDHESVEVLPDWARETLEEHEGDPRPLLASWERLARSRTGDALWDAAQDSLRVQGELHNNVRMTWGKAVLGWTPDAGRALELLVDLNHRYALDGRDPNSYGGILWCLGAFDRPFSPERSVTGRVRSRSTERHAGRLDVARYRARVRRPPVDPPPRTVVVGAGMSGLVVARTLLDHGLPVQVVDKGRRPGGRLATRRSRSSEERAFDHGAQFFTARDPVFRRYVDSWAEEGVVARWDGRTIRVGEDGGREAARDSERWVGVPGMQSVAAWLAADLEVCAGRRVTALRRTDGGWLLEADDTLPLELARPFHRVVLAMPHAQAAELLEPVAPELGERVRSASVAPCWAVLAELEEAVAAGPDGFDAAFLPGDPLSWVARDSSKPGRPAGERWVLHAGPEWSAEHLEEEPETVATLLLEAFNALVDRHGGGTRPEGAAAGLPVRHVQAHRWRYALPTEPLDARYLASEEGLFACGDWCGGPRVEGAFRSGAALAGHLLRTLAPVAAP